MENFVDGIYTVSIKAEQVMHMEQLDPVLHLKEVVAVYNGDKFIGHKVGDGKSKWSELEYVTRIEDIMECWLYIPDKNNPDQMRVGGKIMLDPGYQEW